MMGGRGGVVKGAKLRRGACALIGRVKGVASADDMMLELSGALSARLKLSASASKSKKAVKRGRMNADKDAAQKA